ncbi:MAG: glycine C-acetyltransferase [Puniceicoccaceae bacterium]
MDYSDFIQSELGAITNDGLFKSERPIQSPQGTEVKLANGKTVLNFCANNYLGLANHPELIAAAKASYDQFGFGLSSVRFICGTQTQHKQLEARIAAFLGMEDSILYSSCFDANGGLFEVLLNEEDAIVSDQLNHASIIDGIRLCKAKRYRYANNNLSELEACLQAAQRDGARYKWIVTDGVFSMDGIIADLHGICELAEQYHARVIVDDSHAVGFMGANGRGTHEHCEVMGRVSVITGTLGKALGGASGGYTAASREIVELLRQRSRPYLFSNSLAPAIVAASLRCIDLMEHSDDRRQQLWENTRQFRSAMQEAGFDIVPGTHPIVPVMLGEATLAQRYAAELLEHGIYAIGFYYPVVPKGKARIRLQISASHTPEQLERAVEAFGKVRLTLGVS